MSKLKPIAPYIKISLTLIAIILGSSCSNQEAGNRTTSSIKTEQAKEEKATVTISPMYLRTGSNQSEILPIHIEFSVQKETKEYVEDQIDEIKRILIVYFSDVNPNDLKSKKSFTMDSNLTSTINDFLKSGHIEASKYKVVKEVL